MLLHSTFRVGLCATFACLGASLARAQIQSQALTSPHAEPGSFFGAAVAADGDTAVLAGAGFGGADWRAFVYVRRSREWVFEQALEDSGYGPETPLFGRAVAINGDWIAVGGPDLALYERGPSGWTLQQVIDGYVNSVTMQGQTLVAGCEGQNLARVFERIEGTWTLTSELVSEIEYEHFGASVALDGEWLVVGAPMSSSVFGIENKGQAYFYRRRRNAGEPSEWILETKQKGGLAEAFGAAVAIEGRLALVGAPGQFDTGGIVLNKVHVYRLANNGNWAKHQVLSIPDSQFPEWAHDEFGGSLALRGFDLVVGAQLYYSEQIGIFFKPMGAAYHYRLVDGKWQLGGRLRSTHQGLTDYLGTSVALAGSQALVGAPGHDSACPDLGANCNSGEVYVFELAEGATQFGSCTASAPCGNTSFHGGCENSTRMGAVLSSAGTSKVSEDDLWLEARWVPSNTPVLWRMGSKVPLTPFGDGLLCTRDANVLAVATTDGEGVAQLGPGLAALSQTVLPPEAWIEPGDAWSFQCSYRDPAGPCGSGFNHTNGVSVAFVP